MLSPSADEQNYLLRDAEAEVLFSFSLEESLRRAHAAPLFKVRLDGSSAHCCRWAAVMERVACSPLALRSRASSWVCAGAKRIDTERDALHITRVQRVCYE